MAEHHGQITSSTSSQHPPFAYPGHGLPPRPSREPAPNVQADVVPMGDAATIPIPADGHDTLMVAGPQILHATQLRSVVRYGSNPYASHQPSSDVTAQLLHQLQAEEIPLANTRAEAREVIQNQRTDLHARGEPHCVIKQICTKEG